MKTIIKYITACCLLFFCLQVRPHTYNFRGLSVSDGLSNMIVTAFYKDSTGYTWIGTGSTVERFDGIHLKHYQIPGKDEKLKRVNAFIELPGNDLWMGNGMGLWRLDKDKSNWEQIDTEIINARVRSFLCHNGNLYIGSDNGLFIYREGIFRQLLVDSNIFSKANSIAAMALDEDGMLWLATSAGLYSVRLQDDSITSYPNGGGPDSYNSLARVSSVLYLGTEEQGIVSFDTCTGMFSPYISVGCNVISCLSTDGEDLLYVGTDGNGIHFISASQKRIVRSIRSGQGDHGLRSNSVYSLLIDREGIVWVGFYQMGLDYSMYQSTLFSIYSFPPFFDSTDMFIRAIYISEKEKLIGTRDGFYYIDEQCKRFKYITMPQIRSNMVFCCCYYHNEYYIGTFGGGMYVFNPADMSVRDFTTLQNPFVNGQIFDICSDHEDNLWISTAAGLFCYKDNSLVAHYTHVNSRLPEGNVYSIFFDSTHKGWVLTDNGFCIYDSSSRSLKTDIFPDGFIHSQKIRAMYEDSDHQLYFMPDRGLLFTSDLSMTRFSYIQAETPLTGKDIMFMMEDKGGWLWIGTNNGLYHYDKKSEFVEYNFTDGIPSPNFYNCRPVHTSKGGIWFGNSRGLLYWDASQMGQNENPPYSLSIVDVEVNGKNPHADLIQNNEKEYSLLLKPTQENITVRVSNFTYINPSFMSYEYMMEDEDTEWTKVTGESSISLYSLTSGSHRFKVRCSGKPNTEICLVINKESVLNVWQKLLIAVAIVLVIIGYVYHRRREQQSKDLTDREEATPIPEKTQPIERIPEPTEASVSVTEEKYKTYNISADECAALSDKLEHVLRMEKLYMRSDLKIADLAAATGASSQMLSYFFNQYLNRNYYDYINDYRIEEFKSMVSGGEYSKYTISALAELCGFTSKSSFFRYFKKTTGITPNEYIQNMEKNRR